MDRPYPRGWKATRWGERAEAGFGNLVLRIMSAERETFKCAPNCGECCRNLRGRLDESRLPGHYSGLKKMSRSTGIQLLIHPSKMTILLFDWEVNHLERLARRENLIFRCTPHMVALDAESHRILVLTWNLDHDNCPFLDDESRCKVYDERPLTCRSFPVSFLGGKVKLLDLCPAIVPIGESGEHTTPRIVDSIYPGCAEAALSLENVAKELMKVYSELLVARGGFVPVLGASRRLIRKEIKKTGKMVGFVEWMSVATGQPAEDVEDVVKGWYQMPP